MHDFVDTTRKYGLVGQTHASELQVVAPQALFDVRPVGPRSFFDVMPDGQRFLVNSRRTDSLSSSITLLQNWTSLTPP